MGLIKTKRSHVAMNCSSLKCGIKAIDYSALVIVELLSEMKKIEKDEDAPSFKKLLDILKDLTLRIRSHDYSKDALLSLVKEVYLSGKSVFDLADIIGNSAYCFFPIDENEHMFFRSVSNNPPILRSDYGNEPYIAPVKTETEVVDKPPRHTRKSKAAIIVPQAREKLCDMPEIIALKTKYKELEQPLKKYFWEWRVSTEDYRDFKQLLINVNFSIRTRDKVRECAYQLCFFIAEWYKREYDGNESVNCLAELGIEGSGLTEEIWKHSLQSHDEQPYITEESNFHEWLYSIYVLGGFPIKYTQRSSRFSSLFDEIWGEDQNQDVISDEQLDELTQEFAGNQVVKNSLISGSLHDYYRYLRKATTMPIALSDLDKEPFAGFIRKLQEGKKKYYEQYLKPTWLLYVDSHDSHIDGEVQVSFGRKNDKCYIPIECLSYWNIPGARTLSGFDLEVSESISGEKTSIRFSKTGPDDYPFVGWSKHNIITLPIPIDEDSRIEVFLVTNKERFKIGNTYSFGDSRQFYKTKQPYEWSSRTDNSAHTAVLFCPTRLSLCDSPLHPEEKFFHDGGRIWNWLILTEEVSLVDESGDIVTYAPRNSSLEIIFKQIPNTVKYVNFRDVVHHQFVDGELLQTAVTLLKENGFSIRYTPYGGNPKNVSLSRCSVTFKRAGESKYVIWDEANHPGQGLMHLRVVYKDKGVSSTRLVYYLPQINPIKRVTNNNMILFGQELEDVYAPGSDGYMPLLRDEEGQFRYYDDIANGYLPQSDTIPFLLGKPEEEYVIINIFRSTKCTELYLNGDPEPITRYEQGNGLVDIPVVMRRNFEVRTINSSGVSRVKCGDDVYMRFDLPIYSNYCIDKENGFRYYSAKRPIKNEEDTYVTFVLETSPSQYRFYYWSMNVGEEPVLLEQKIYNPDNKSLEIDISPLRRNNRGIVFQSLRGVAPRHYFGPIYGNQRESLYGRQKMVQCFNVASEHNIPFIVFPVFKEMFTTREDIIFFLSKFWVELMESRDWKPSTRDFTNLHRLAYEFLFDWIMLPKVLWANSIREWRRQLLGEKGDDYMRLTSEAFKKIMLKLFRTSPYINGDDIVYLEKILEKYWSFRPSDRWSFRRSQKPENILAQCIRGSNGDYFCFDRNIERRLTFLRNIHESNTLFEGLYKLMTIN